jgi:hypothetical protein
LGAIGEKLKEWRQKNKDEDSFKKRVGLLKEALTYAPLIAITYLLAAIFGVVIFKVESTNEILEGLVLESSLIATAFMPLFILSFKNLLDENKIMQNIVLSIQVVAGFYSLIMIILFIHENNGKFGEYKNISEVLGSLIHYLFHFLV